MKKITPLGILSLTKLALRSYWLMIAWFVACAVLFRFDYLHYKRAPQYYYLRRMLGVSVCVSRGTAALINVGIFLLVLPKGKSVLSLVRSCLPLWFNLVCVTLVPSSKTMHLVTAFTILLASVAHSISHILNAINFSRHYIPSLPEVNMASYKGESPIILIFTSVPGISGVSMLGLLAVMGITSLKCVRMRQYEVFYYTHYCCVLFLFILLIHPLGGVLKGVLNIDSHPPGCRFMRPMEISEVVNASQGKELPGPSHEHSQLRPTKNSSLISSGPVLKSYDQELQFSQFSKEQMDYSQKLEVIGYPEPYDYDDVWGYPEPFDGVEYPDPDEDPFKHEGVPKQKVISDNLVDVSSESSVNLKNAPYPRRHRQRERKYCLEPPLFVTIESKTWLWVLMTMLYLLLDFIVKLWRGHQEVEVVRVREFPADVLEVTLRKRGFRCNPGQYILLRCPQVSPYQWHPFTVAQCPTSRSGCFTLLIRTKGNWCKKLRHQIFLSLLKIGSTNLSLQNCQKHRTYANNHSYSINSNYDANVGRKLHCHALQKDDGANNHRELYRLNSANISKNKETDVNDHPQILNALSSGLSPQEVTQNVLCMAHLETFNQHIPRMRRESYQYPAMNQCFSSQSPHYSQFNNLLHASCEAKRSNISCRRSPSYPTDHLPLALDHLSLESQRPVNNNNLKDSVNDRLYHRPNLNSRNSSENWNQIYYGFPTPNTTRAFRIHKSNNHIIQNSKNNCPTHTRTVHGTIYCNVHQVHKGHQVSRSFNGSRPNWDNLGVLEHAFASPSPKGGRPISESPDAATYISVLSPENGDEQKNCPYILDIEEAQYLPSFRLFFDGPFSSPNESILSYPVVIGIVGGIGVTPLMASLNNLRTRWQTKPRRLHVVWILRELQLVLPLAPFFHSLIEFFWSRKEEDRLELRFHCTSSELDEEFLSLLHSNYPFLKARVHMGRPNWNDLFGVWKEAYRKCTVGVFCCGPKSLNREIRNYTLEALGQGYNFNYQHESFS